MIMAGESVATRVHSLTAGGVTVGGVTQTVAADRVTTFKKTIPANTTNGVVEVVVDISAVKACGIVANKACTVKTNSTSAPDDTLTLAENKPLIYVHTDPDSNLFLSADVTTLYVTTTVATELKVVVCEDSTPGLGE